MNSIECPICFDVIGDKNNITTDCGHKFHASCLMTNITRNGFGCPCCRAVMAENDTNDSDENESNDDEDTYDSDEDTYDSDEDEELFSDYALRGLRLFTNQLENVASDQEDISDEIAESNNRPLPSAEHVMRLLSEDGYLQHHIVSAMLAYHKEYRDNTDIQTQGTNLWNKVSHIIDNFVPDVNVDIDIDHIHPNVTIRRRN